ncbi:hypothetical protein PIIN_08113 [Serendipita indica DSM 11827]|uniref:BSD domain-containing protein n=1 Tax=Serendipita indica (strain DSM 11827) TaxID=1109443 RepID=G4TS67_SERID|nr:hypothetical protein PIIN_08113 [Serendipita indica DSM 11827]
MNAMDVYDFDEQTTPAPQSSSSGGSAATTTAQPTLNEEVQQAIGSFGRFWGGFRAQSISALATARKDLGSVVQQAQQELSKLAAPSPTSPPPTSTETTSATADTSEKSKDVVAGDGPTETKGTSSPRASTSESGSNLFSYIQSSLVENLSTAQSTVQRTLASPEVQNLRSNINANISHLQEAVQTQVHQVQSNPTIQSLQSSVRDLNIQSRVQDLQQNVASNVPHNAAEARERIKGLEGLAEGFWKSTGEFFREAVKIVPPTEEELQRSGSGTMGLGIDGMDMWAFDELGGVVTDETEVDGKGKVKAPPASSGIGLNRTAALLSALRTDPSLLRADPEAGEGKDAYTRFVTELDSKGATVGSEPWVRKCDEELGLFDDLKKTKDQLVPEEMDEATFWTRYWFRAWQIRQAEEKRKALLQATMEQEKEDEFSWEDEEETASALTPTAAQGTEGVPSKSLETDAKVQAKEEATSAMNRKHGPSSPSKESEESYDLVSTRSGNTSATGLAAPSGLSTVVEGAKPSGKTEEDEEEEEEESDDEEEDEEDSDWE